MTTNLFSSYLRFLYRGKGFEVAKSLSIFAKTWPFLAQQSKKIKTTNFDNT